MTAALVALAVLWLVPASAEAKVVRPAGSA